MSDSPPTSSDILADAAATAAKLSVDASVKAQEILQTAADVALKERERQDVKNDDITNILVDALNKVFGEKEESQQFINISRVPFICLQIKEIHTKLEDIALSLESMKIVKQIVFGLAALVGTTVVVGLLSMILKK